MIDGQDCEAVDRALEDVGDRLQVLARIERGLIDEFGDGKSIIAIVPFQLIMRYFK